MLEPIHINQIKLAGEIGRRIDATIENNIFKINIDEDFIKPFQDKKRRGGPRAFVGTGKLLDAVVCLAAYSDEKNLVSLKQHMIASLIAAQEPDGYIGTLIPQDRLGSFGTSTRSPL